MSIRVRYWSVFVRILIVNFLFKNQALKFELEKYESEQRKQSELIAALNMQIMNYQKQVSSQNHAHEFKKFNKSINQLNFFDDQITQFFPFLLNILYCQKYTN